MCDRVNVSQCFKGMQLKRQDVIPPSSGYKASDLKVEATGPLKCWYL
jgi:hypothetical protein